MTRKYYDSCMDRNGTMDTLGSAPMLTLIEDMGGWNITQKIDVSRWSLLEALKTLQLKYSIDGFFAWVVGEFKIIINMYFTLSWSERYSAF